MESSKWEGCFSPSNLNTRKITKNKETCAFHGSTPVEFFSRVSVQTAWAAALVSRLGPRARVPRAPAAGGAVQPEGAGRGLPGRLGVSRGGGLALRRARWRGRGSGTRVRGGRAPFEPPAPSPGQARALPEPAGAKARPELPGPAGRGVRPPRPPVRSALRRGFWGGGGRWRGEDGARPEVGAESRPGS